MRRFSDPEKQLQHIRKMTSERVEKQLSIPAKERIMARVVFDNDCWMWDGRPSSSGYAKISFQSKDCYAHRLAYETFNGPIPEGMSVDHVCRRKMCVNPRHLRLANKSQNAQNHGGAQKRSKTGIRGVWKNSYGTYSAQLKISNEPVWVGNFQTLDEAEIAVIRARIKHFTHNDRDHVRLKELTK